MPEAGGPAAQSGFHYQNAVAALALADLLDLNPRVPRERAVEVRVEAPQDVDDVTIRFADGHSDSQSIKLAIRRRTVSGRSCGVASDDTSTPTIPTTSSP